MHLLTVAMRWRDGNTEWRFYNVATKDSPIAWLYNRLKANEPYDNEYMGRYAQVDAVIIRSQEIRNDQEWMAEEMGWITE